MKKAVVLLQVSVYEKYFKVVISEGQIVTLRRFDMVMIYRIKLNTISVKGVCIWSLRAR